MKLDIAQAISSLPSFAAACDVFLVVAPVATHANTLQRCDLASYRGRGWCRAEMLAFWARRGSADMYRATADAAVVPLFAGSIFSDSHECCLSEAAQSRGEERSEGMQGSRVAASLRLRCVTGRPTGRSPTGSSTRCAFLTASSRAALCAIQPVSRVFLRTSTPSSRPFHTGAVAWATRTASRATASV